MELEFKELLEEYTLHLEEKDVLNFWKMRRRFPHEFHTQGPSIEVINSYDGESQHKGMFDSEGYLEYFKILDYYEKGHTIIMSNIFDLTEELRMLEGAISDSFAFYPVYGNFYMSKEDKGGFKSHDHQYDVYVKQIYGTSHWVLGETKNVTVNPGDVIYIPKYTKHYVDNTDGPRLSLTINMT
jgi:mannose-6-phosphate isomerase-like protein (cupin superfamily)